MAPWAYTCCSSMQRTFYALFCEWVSDDNDECCAQRGCTTWRRRLVRACRLAAGRKVRGFEGGFSPRRRRARNFPCSRRKRFREDYVSACIIFRALHAEVNWLLIKSSVVRRNQICSGDQFWTRGAQSFRLWWRAWLDVYYDYKLISRRWCTEINSVKSRTMQDTTNLSAEISL